MRLGLKIHLIKHFRDCLYKRASLISLDFGVHGERKLYSDHVECCNRLETLSVSCSYSIVIKYAIDGLWLISITYFASLQYWVVSVWRQTRSFNPSYHLFVYPNEIVVEPVLYTPAKSDISKLFTPNTYKDWYKLIPIILEI